MNIDEQMVTQTLNSIQGPGPYVIPHGIVPTIIPILSALLLSDDDYNILLVDLSELTVYFRSSRSNVQISSKSRDYLQRALQEYLRIINSQSFENIKAAINNLSGM